MGYFTSDDLPYRHDLASEFTICDQHHCSLNGPTTPSRAFKWAGTNNPQGGLGGPAIDNPPDCNPRDCNSPDCNPVNSWGTHPEQLQNGGVTWKVFANDEIGDGANGPFGDYGDNPLWLFTANHDSIASTDPALQQLAIDGGLHGGTWKPCTRCEHPSASPDYGAVHKNAVVDALFANPALGKSTVFFINYDENDGYFDHVMPPFPESGTLDEFVGGLPVGFGTRVPMTVVSPWSRGGLGELAGLRPHLGHQVHRDRDRRQRPQHLRVTAKGECGPHLLLRLREARFLDPAPHRYLEASGGSDRGWSKPPVAAPAVGAQVMPTQQPASRRHRPIPHQQNANVTVDRSTGSVTPAMTNVGDAAVSMAV